MDSNGHATAPVAGLSGAALTAAAAFAQSLPVLPCLPSSPGAARSLRGGLAWGPHGAPSTLQDTVPSLLPCSIRSQIPAHSPHPASAG